MKQENEISNNVEKKKNKAFILWTTAPLIIGLCLVFLFIYIRYAQMEYANKTFGMEIHDLRLYDITFPLLILNLGMYKSSLYKNKRFLYVLVNVALIILNVFVLMR